jgi:hypothetical protein
MGIHFLYFLFAWLSYKFIFNHEMMRHPRFLENQVKQEIQCSLRAFPAMTLLTLPWFQAEVMGYSKLYDNVEEYGWTYLALSVPLSVLPLSIVTIYLTFIISFLLFTDYGIYWVHRLLHHPNLYRTFHKPHHKWISMLLCSVCHLPALKYFGSTYPLCLSRFPPRGRLPSICPISPLHIYIPSSPMVISRSLRFRQFLEYSRACFGLLTWTTLTPATPDSRLRHGYGTCP